MNVALRQDIRRRPFSKRSPSTLFILASLLIVPKPADSQPLSSEFMKVEVVEAGGVYDVFAASLVHSDVTFTLEMELTNLKASKSLPFIGTIRGKQREKILQLELVNKKKGGGYECKYFYRIGNLNAEHDTTNIYQLPYEIGASHRVTQSYFGKFSHDENSHYAVDFAMSVGTKVCAAREGIVVGFYENSDQGGPNDKYLKLSNYILIRHSDLTIGAYYHLKNKGVLVRIGEKVARGQVIAYSGNTGFSFAPHLHFEVLKAKTGKESQSLPIKFKTRRGIISEPLQGKSYIAK